MNEAEKLVVVSGGSKGIGRAVVRRFLAAGHPVATCARSAADLARLAAECSADFPGSALHTQVADLADPAACGRFAAFVQALGPPVTVLVHNAGAFLPGRLQDEPADGSQLRRMLAVNLLSAYDLTLPLLPGLIGRGTGHVFTICSTASLTAYPNGGSYGIAKHALYGFTRNLRAELQDHGVRVTAVLPGATFTDSWAGAGLPETRFIGAADVAEAVFGAYALSPSAVVEEILIRPQLGDI